MRYIERINFLAHFMNETEQEVSAHFSQLPGAIRYEVGRHHADMVFVPPTRDDYVVLVAHTDTVWDDCIDDIYYYEDEMFSAEKSPRGIGADCRAGCAALWYLRNSGHALLLTSGEEVGGVAANQVETHPWLVTYLAASRALIQFDRRGSGEVVNYSPGSDQLMSELATAMGREQADGSYTDVATIEQVCGVQGVNISIGFYYEHTRQETLDVRDWYRTVRIMQRVLSRPWPEQYVWTDVEPIVRKWQRPYDYFYDDFDDMTDNIGDDVPDGVHRYDGAECPHCGDAFELWCDYENELFFCTICGWCSAEPEHASQQETLPLLSLDDDEDIFEHAM